jgi:hypothetical protein
LLEGDLGLGLESDLLGHPGLLAAGGIAGPVLRQIEPPGHRQARLMIGDRQRHRNLAIILLAELAAILPRHPHRVLALLGEAVRLSGSPSMIQASIGP